jgi:hypothetical protein
MRFSNISNRDNSNQDNPRFRNLKVNNRNNNLRREFSSRKDGSKDLRISNHNNLSLKKNLRGEVEHKKLDDKKFKKVAVFEATGKQVKIEFVAAKRRHVVLQ